MAPDASRPPLPIADRVRPRRRRYTSRNVGKVRERLALKLATQLKADGFKARVDAANLWPAQGRWRSDHRMDVMRWEGQVDLDRGWGFRSYGIGSWQTMTELVRAGVVLEIEFDGLDFEVSEASDAEAAEQARAS